MVLSSSPPFFKEKRFLTHVGDKVDHKGALTGGFHDERISRLDAAIQVTRLYEQLSREVQESAMSKSRIVTLDTNITQLLSDVQVLETRIKNESESQLDMAKQLKALQGEYQNALEALNKLENLKRKTILEIQKQQQELNSMEVELKSEFNVSVEATNMTQLAEQLEALRAQQASCSETRGKVMVWGCKEGTETFGRGLTRLQCKRWNWKAALVT